MNGTTGNPSRAVSARFFRGGTPRLGVFTVVFLF
jgi:hypothetical protein